ncbi:MAG TPA: hypothetical protein VMH50_01355 [Thermoleophilia bacterium]|nr:hypothetical protein [Thermoleophilia bacterium]
MLVATFGPTTAWQGREIIWDVDHFILVGHGAVPAAGLLDYDRRGQLVWADPGYRAWVAAVDVWEHGGRSTVMGAGVALPGGAPAQRKSRVPGWVWVVAAVGAVALIVAIVLVSLIPTVIRHTTQTLSQDMQVRSGVSSLQTGIESYAAEHHGRFPDPGELDPVGMSRYITVWPTNPYSGMPMADGGGEGNFRYDVSPDGGAYKLIGYGRAGGVVIELNGGTTDTV